MIEVATPFKRLSPEEVAQAYKKSGVIPGTGAWTFLQEGQICCCGIGMMAMLEDPRALEQLKADEDLELAGDMLGLNLSYTTGFVMGFDGKSLAEMSSYFDRDHYTAGHEDGAATRLLVNPRHAYEGPHDEEED